MNKSLMSLLTNISWIFLMFVTACTSLQAPIPKETFTALPTTAAPTQTAIEIPSITPTQHHTVDITPFPKSSDYLIYGKVSEDNKHIGMWAIDPVKPVPIFISKTVYSSGWSPSDKLWLLTGDQSIYVANSDGSNIRVVYNSEEYRFFTPFWLTDDVILFNAFKDSLLPPDIYSLNIDTGMVTRLFSSTFNYFIESTFLSEKRWLRGSWSQQTTDIVSENGKVEKFFDGFLILTDPFHSNLRIQQIKGLNKYLFIARKQGDSNYKFWLAFDQEIPQVLFDPGDDGIDQFAISPDERYVAFAYNTLYGEFLYVVSLENRQILYKWVYPHTMSNIGFIWSPDSRSIAFQYSESTTNGSEDGIKIMNVKTGQATIISKDNVLEIIDWRLIK